jgi:GT2 family glycosyltransferase
VLLHRHWQRHLLLLLLLLLLHRHSQRHLLLLPLLLHGGHLLLGHSCCRRLLHGRCPRLLLHGGCSLLLRPAAQPIAPRFDERFPLYYEDMDLCLRLARQGAPVLWLRQPVIVHRKGTGSEAPGPRRLQLSSLSYLRFLRRHSPGWVMALRSLRLLLLTLVRLPLRPQRSLAVLQAMLTVLREPA